MYIKKKKKEGDEYARDFLETVHGVRVSIDF